MYLYLRLYQHSATKIILISQIWKHRMFLWRVELSMINRSEAKVSTLQVHKWATSVCLSHGLSVTKLSGMKTPKGLHRMASVFSHKQRPAFYVGHDRYADFWEENLFFPSVFESHLPRTISLQGLDWSDSNFLGILQKHQIFEDAVDELTPKKIIPVFFCKNRRLITYESWADPLRNRFSVFTRWKYNSERSQNRRTNKQPIKFQALFSHRAGINFIKAG